MDDQTVQKQLFRNKYDMYVHVIFFDRINYLKKSDENRVDEKLASAMRDNEEFTTCILECVFIRVFQGTLRKSVSHYSRDIHYLLFVANAHLPIRRIMQCKLKALLQELLCSSRDRTFRCHYAKFVQNSQLRAT